MTEIQTYRTKPLQVRALFYDGSEEAWEKAHELLGLEKDESERPRHFPAPFCALRGAAYMTVPVGMWMLDRDPGGVRVRALWPADFDKRYELEVEPVAIEIPKYLGGFHGEFDIDLLEAVEAAGREYVDHMLSQPVARFATDGEATS